MKHQTGPRAATIRKILDGSAQARIKPHRTTIIIMPELLEKAERHKICAPKGHGGLRSIRVYFEDCLIRDIREYEKRKEELKNRSDTD